MNGRTAPAAGKSRFFGLSRIAPYMKAYRGTLLLMLLTSAAGSAIDIGTPLFQRYALNRFVARGTTDGMLL